MGLISETEVGYQVDGPHRGRGHEQSHMIFFTLRRQGKHLVQRGDVLAYALTQSYLIYLKTFFSVGERLLYSLSHFFLQTVSILEQRPTMTENKL